MTDDRRHPSSRAPGRRPLPGPEHPRPDPGRLDAATGAAARSSRTDSRATTTSPYEEFTSPRLRRSRTRAHVVTHMAVGVPRGAHPRAGRLLRLRHRRSVGGDRARTRTATIKAFHNACLHRGTQLKPPASVGYSPKLRCPFHGWTWTLDGELIDLPCEWDFPHVDAAEYPLPEIRTGRWGGFVFVNFDDDAPPLEEYLGVLPDHFANWDLADRYVEVHIRKRLPANWKASAEAFLEAYHILETHSQSIYTAGDANAQYDVFGDTRQPVHPHDRHDEPARARGEASRRSRAFCNMLMARKNPGQEVPSIPEGERARDVYARHMQTCSVSSTTTTSATCRWPRRSIRSSTSSSRTRSSSPACRSRCATDSDPTAPTPTAASTRCCTCGRSHAPARCRRRPNRSTSTSTTATPRCPGSRRRSAMVLDQDTANLAAQTRGFKASKKRGQTLGNYQEVRARHFQSTVRRYVAEGQQRHLAPSRKHRPT